jgi:voltage-gated potassium channel
MSSTLSYKIFRKWLWAAVGIVAIVILGTFGYRILGGGNYSYIDCLYMAVITITTIGYGEIIDMSHNPAGRIFTIFFALTGIGMMTYILMSATAFVVEGRINEVFRRRRMEKNIGKLRRHYIICGVEGVGHYIGNELHSTQRPFVLVDAQRKAIDRVLEAYPDQIFVEGDPADNVTLLKAGIEQADGLFAATGDDNQNLIISLTAKQLNPHVKVVACCNDLKNCEKTRKAGADGVVSPSFIGGLRMASEMVRPAVVSFLDLMLRRDDETMRVEEIVVPEHLAGKPLSGLNLKNHPHLLLLAVKSGNDWTYNPSREYRMKVGDILIFMACMEERFKFEEVFSSP